MDQYSKEYGLNISTQLKYFDLCMMCLLQYEVKLLLKHSVVQKVFSAVISEHAHRAKIHGGSKRPSPIKKETLKSTKWLVDILLVTDNHQSDICDVSFSC